MLQTVNSLNQLLFQNKRGKTMRINYKITVLVVVALFFSTFAFASEKMVTIPETVYNEILNRLNDLQKKVDKLEKAGKKTVKKEKQVDENLDDIYDTLDKVETKTIKDRLNFGLELRTRVDDFKIKNELNTKTGKNSDYSSDNRWTSRFRLNLSSEITKGLVFHGRLAVYKNWANTSSAVPSTYADPNASHVPGDTALKVDRAYIDWTIPKSPVPIALTIGRQPSTEGPGAEFKENEPRQSTYPALLFDGESDGIIATFGLERYLKIKNSGLRFAYGKGYQSNDDKTTYLGSRYGLDDLNVFGAFFETELPYLKDSLMVLSYVRGNDFVDSPVNPGKNLGDMDLMGVHVQTPHLFNSNFDLFFSCGFNKSHPNGESVNVTVGTGPGGAPIIMPMGLLSSDGQKSHKGWAIFTGFRYTIPFESFNNPKIGFEYNHGSKYWFSFTQGSTDLYNKLSTRGNVYDFYYIQPFNKYVFLRTGYTLLKYNYSGSGWHIGQPMSIDRDLNDFYLLFNCRF